MFTMTLEKLLKTPFLQKNTKWIGICQTNGVYIYAVSHAEAVIHRCSKETVLESFEKFI